MKYGLLYISHKTVVLYKLWTATFAEAVCQNVSIIYYVYSVW